ADFCRENDRDRLFRGIFGRLVGMRAAPCVHSGAIAINGRAPGAPCLLESIEYSRCGGIRHGINRRAAPHHYSLRHRETESDIAANCLFRVAASVRLAAYNRPESDPLA